MCMRCSLYYVHVGCVTAQYNLLKKIIAIDMNVSKTRRNLLNTDRSKLANDSKIVEIRITLSHTEVAM